MRYNIKVKLCLLKKVPAVTITVFITILEQNK